MLLNVLMPTYNRVSYLKKNCEQIADIIKKNDLGNEVGLVISNNNSTDETKEFLNDFVESSTIRVEVINQIENIGSVSNVLFLLNSACSEYVLFLGDDDYLHDDYIAKVIALIKEKSTKLSAIIPSNIAISENGELLGYSRDIGLSTKIYSPGFENCLENSWRGHQLSGLVFRREGLAKLCKNNEISNMYLFIYLVAVSALKGSVVHLTEYPVRISRPAQKDKGWGYGVDGLISHIFDNYRKLDGVTKFQRMRLELKILDEQYWRYVMYLKKSGKHFFNAMTSIVFGKNTSTPTRILFPFLFPYFIVKRVVILMLSGEFLKTLSRPVDI